MDRFWPRCRGRPDLTPPGKPLFWLLKIEGGGVKIPLPFFLLSPNWYRNKKTTITMVVLFYEILFKYILFSVVMSMWKKKYNLTTKSKILKIDIFEKTKGCFYLKGKIIYFSPTSLSVVGTLILLQMLLDLKLIFFNLTFDRMFDIIFD